LLNFKNQTAEVMHLRKQFSTLREKFEDRIIDLEDGIQSINEKLSEDDKQTLRLLQQFLVDIMEEVTTAMVVTNDAPSPSPPPQQQQQPAPSLSPITRPGRSNANKAAGDKVRDTINAVNRLKNSGKRGSTAQASDLMDDIKADSAPSLRPSGLTKAAKKLEDQFQTMVWLVRRIYELVAKLSVSFMKRIMENMLAMGKENTPKRR
jgi:hypothetical protein